MTSCRKRRWRYGALGKPAGNRKFSGGPYQGGTRNVSNGAGERFDFRNCGSVFHHRGPCPQQIDGLGGKMEAVFPGMRVLPSRVPFLIPQNRFVFPVLVQLHIENDLGKWIIPQVYYKMDIGTIHLWIHLLNQFRSQGMSLAFLPPGREGRQTVPGPVWVPAHCTLGRPRITKSSGRKVGIGGIPKVSRIPPPAWEAPPL